MHTLVTNVLAHLWARVRLHRCSLGPRVRLTGRPRLVNYGSITIGERVQLVSTVAKMEFVTSPVGTIDIGARSLVNFGTSIVAFERVTIGEDCLIGPHCMIMDTPFHNIEPDRRLEPPMTAPITIGDNVWLGARVIVMPGVTIGKNSVVGIGSIVTSDVPENSLGVGVPMRVIRQV